MAIKGEIAWTRSTDEGKLQVYARRFGGEWKFYHRARRNDLWQESSPVPLEDWLELLDAVRRRVPRRLFPPDEVHRIITMIRQHFPDVKDP